MRKPRFELTLLCRHGQALRTMPVAIQAPEKQTIRPPGHLGRQTKELGAVSRSAESCRSPQAGIRMQRSGRKWLRFARAHRGWLLDAEAKRKGQMRLSARRFEAGVIGCFPISAAPFPLHHRRSPPVLLLCSPPPIVHDYVLLRHRVAISTIRKPPTRSSATARQSLGHRPRSGKTRLNAATARRHATYRRPHFFITAKRPPRGPRLPGPPVCNGRYFEPEQSVGHDLAPV